LTGRHCRCGCVRLVGPLDKLREWLVDKNAVIMAVLLLVLGVAVIGKGFADF
jgi:hypothetical protein